MSSLLFLGADHAGFELKEKIRAMLQDAGINVQDLSPTFLDGDDYPKPGFAVAEAVAATPDSKGLLFCGSGIGIAIAANRVPGARAAVAHSEDEVALARQHDHINILALPGRTLKAPDAASLVKTFLHTKSDLDDRHQRRVAQLG